MIFISEQEVLQLLNWNKAFTAIEVALKKISQGEVVLNARTHTAISPTKILISMPGYLKDEVFGGLGCKLVTSFQDNQFLEKPVASVNGSIFLFDDDVGVLKAVIAGNEITKWRTAAASAVATKHLMKPKRDYKVLAILGCGEQGIIHAEAFFHFFQFKQIRLWNRTADKAKSAAKELNEKYNTTVFISSLSNEACVRDADVIVTATYASSRLINHEWVKQGAHINAVGYGPNHYSELDPKLYLTSDVFVDHWKNIKTELSGLDELGVVFQGEIGSVINGDIVVKDNPEQITIFQNNGLAVEDCAMARFIYDAYVNKHSTE